MFYYRYRPGSELSLKELIYDEMFFATAAECNDPYEGKYFAQFPADHRKWANLIQAAVECRLPQDLVDRLAAFFVERSPMNVDVLLQMEEVELFGIGASGIECYQIKIILEILKAYVRCYVPAEQYFVCFSRTPDNYLMWSHYANNHKGYCLIFRERDGKLAQHPDKKRTSLSFPTPNGFAPHMSFAVEEAFRIRDVEYVENPPYMDAFTGFPIAVNESAYSQEEIDTFRQMQGNVYYCKHSVWKYEQESRIVLSGGVPWLTGAPLPVSEHKRLFYYDPAQLAGIILGAQMPGRQKKQIREIITEKREQMHATAAFVIFEERLSELNREISTEPVEIYTETAVLKSDDPQFAKHYNEWLSINSL